MFIYILEKRISIYEKTDRRKYNLPTPALIESYYGIVDAGSTGSRLYMYKVIRGTNNKLEYLRFPNGTIVSHKITPGLSDFTENLDEAVKYMLSLLKWLENSIDNKIISKTSVSILATAGMRLLSTTQQNKIMEKLKKELPRRTRLKIVEVRVISGIMEGVYQWVANNYLSGKIERYNANYLSQKGSEYVPPSTKGIVEMGGASLQIVYEKSTNSFHNEIFTYWNPSYRQKFKFKLHSESLLGYGMQSMLNWYLSPNNTHSTLEQKSACLLKNGRKTVHYGSDNNNNPITTVVGNGNFEVCLESLEEALVNSGKILKDSSNNLHFPANKLSIPITDKSTNDILSLSIPEFMEIDGFSEYFYGSFEFYNFEYPFTIENSVFYTQKAKEYCSSNFSNILYRLRQGLFNTRNEENILNQCFKSAYILIVNKIICKKGNRLTPRFKYGNKEVQWTYGALIDYLSRIET